MERAGFTLRSAKTWGYSGGWECEKAACLLAFRLFPSLHCVSVGDSLVINEL